MKVFFHILIGLVLAALGAGLAWHEEAPQREAEERAREHEIAREKEEIRKREAEWQEYERKVASLPVPTPKADIRECLEAFRTYLNRVWPRLPQDLFTPNDEDYELIHNWLDPLMEE